ncbi:MAG: ribosomal assembly protein [Thermoplasmata archaeon]|jgi:ribosomal RNA assembly protein|nr:ribosomal assembly protein [Thermoplasmata archaeon]
MTVVLRIPGDRIGVLIGPNGDTRRLLTQRSGIRIEVDSELNEVSLYTLEPGVDAVMALKLRDIVKAIGRGFSPEHAMRLFSDDCYFELLDFHDYVGKHKGHIRRVTSRLIGSEGKTRRIIEEQTGCDLAIYGHTVGIIGDLEDLGNAKQAVDMILRGAEHASVYRFLENQRRKARRSNAELW